MRHHGLRLVISTQSPLTIAPEIVDLSSAVFIHQFHALEWFKYLSKKIPLKESDYLRIIGLETGRALVLSTNGGEGVELVWEIDVRRRITADLGASKTHRSVE
jgi:hypothetical protein